MCVPKHVGMALFAFYETAYLSAWSIMHFLSGYVWHVVWAWASDLWEPWLSLFLLMLLAMVFELLENNPVCGAPMWAWLGYDRTTYAGDTASNSVSDLLCSLLGWGVVHLVATLSMETAALTALLSAGGVLFVVFLGAFYVERSVVFGKTDKGTPAPTALPALLVSREPH